MSLKSFDVISAISFPIISKNSACILDSNITDEGTVLTVIKQFIASKSIKMRFIRLLVQSDFVRADIRHGHY